MEDESSADESSSEANNTKVAGPIRASARVVNADGIGDLTDTETILLSSLGREKSCFHRNRCKSQIQPGCSPP
ncbi:hypothetical protein TNCV_591431 [Trichonephila clavipes]|nr:hypothetical protein TNCV_591431 [Trichonephila clavipes]